MISYDDRSESGWLVVVTGHALEQAAERAGITDAATISEQVEQALAAGRVSAHRPDWLDHRSTSIGRGLYVWTEDGVVFTLAAEVEAFFVTTTLTASEAAAA